MTGTPLCACGQPSPDAVLCGACTRDLAAKLAAVAAIAPDLEDAVARQLKRGGGGKRSGDEQPLPYDARAADVRDDLYRTLRHWVFELGNAARVAAVALVTDSREGTSA